MGITCNDINRRIKAAGYPMVTIERGDGYIYLVFETETDDAGLVYETYSIMTPYLSVHTYDEWVSYATDFAEAVMDGRYDSGRGVIHPRPEYQPENTRTPIRTVDLTPTWTGLMPGLIAVLENGDSEAGRQGVRDELMRLAHLVDHHNLETKKEKAA